MGVIALLLKNKTLVIIGLLLVALAGSVFYIKQLTGENNTLVAQNTNLSNLLESSQGTVKQLQNDISTQNQAVEDLKTAADARKKESEVLVKKAQDSAAAYKKRADDLLKRVVPQTVSRCDAANLLIDEEITNAKK